MCLVDGINLNVLHQWACFSVAFITSSKTEECLKHLLPTLLQIGGLLPENNTSLLPLHSYISIIQTIKEIMVDSLQQQRDGAWKAQMHIPSNAVFNCVIRINEHNTAVGKSTHLSQYWMCILLLNWHASELIFRASIQNRASIVVAISTLCDTKFQGKTIEWKRRRVDR